VTPEIDLAKLALITSKDEETETLVSAAAQSKDSSLKSVLPDGTLTEPFIGPVRPPPPPPSPTQSPITSSHQPPPDQQIPNPSSPPSSTVLGKRPFNAVERRSTIEIDGSSFVMATSSEQTSAGLLVANKPQRANTEPLQSAAGPLASQEPSQSRSQGDGDVEMTDASQVTSNAVASTSKHEDRVYGPPPPPLPPRNKKPEVRVDMMFGMSLLNSGYPSLDESKTPTGKQNDVAECMDNCMFQIEAAMQFDVVPAEDRPSLIKR
jgi:ubiquitin carboxyl-terminal hydrolase 25/28